MKRPLFWKLLIGSWLTLILVALGNALVIRAASKSFIPWMHEAVQRFERRQVNMAAGLMESLGRPGLDAFAHNLPAGDELNVLTDSVDEQPSSTGPHLRSSSRIIHTASGNETLVYKSSVYQLLPPLPSTLSSLPMQLLFVEFVTISIFAVFFARYLARPVQVLRAGLERVAAGDLHVRAYKQLAPRRDEMADLAQNFDLMAERLQQLLHARERLLHDVSHELRSPLTRLRVAVDLARQNPSRSLESMDRIEQEIQRLSDLVDELLSLSRAEFNAAKSETYIAIAELVAAVAEDAKFEARAKGVEVRLEMPEQFTQGASPVTNGSPELLRKGFDNVLRNAVKVSAPGQTVTVRVDAPSTPSDQLRITVSDQGPGVPTESLDRIFEPFVRLESHSHLAGYGLGLAIARSAAQAHHGTVRAVNRSSGGLSIVFELPIRGSDGGGRL
jgi:two-component system OmpR family sensor kinase